MKEQRSLPRRMLNWVTGSTTDLGKNFNESRKIAKDHFDRNISTIKRDQAINAENNVKFRPDTIADYNDNWHDAKSEVSKTKSTGPYADAEIQKAELSKYRTQVNSDTPETGRKWKREGNKWEQFVDATENKNEDVMPKNLQDTAKKFGIKRVSRLMIEQLLYQNPAHLHQLNLLIKKTQT